MVKYSVNLILKEEKESPLVKKLKIIFPLVSFLLLIFFGLIFLFTYFYINANSREFNLLNKEIERYEKQISEYKITEGIYTLTGSKLKVIDELLADSKNFSPVVGTLLALQTSGITITSITTDKLGNISFSIIASSSASMDMFVNKIIEEENEELFSDITAQGIVRDKKGNYILSISAKGNKELFTINETN